MTFVSVIKKEFTRKNLSLKFHKVEAFCESQWLWPPWVFVVYRLVLAFYSLFSLTHMALHEAPLNLTCENETFSNCGDELEKKHFKMAMLTNWTYSVETLFFVMAAFVAVLHFFWPDYLMLAPVETAKEDENKEVTFNQSTSERTSLISSNSYKAPNPPQPVDLNKQDKDPTTEKRHKPRRPSRFPWFVQIFWVVTNVIQTFAVIVTVTYFGVLLGSADFLGSNTHLISSLMILIDLAVSARPVRLMHVLWPYAYGIVYLVFSVVYWSLDKPYHILYPILDWNKPWLIVATLCAMGIVAIPGLHLANFGIYKLRLRMYERRYGESYL